MEHLENGFNYLTPEEFEGLVDHIKEHPKYSYEEDPINENKCVTIAHCLYASKEDVLAVAKEFDLQWRDTSWLNLGAGSNLEWDYDENGNLVEYRTIIVSIGVDWTLERKVCKCNQGGRRVDRAGIDRLNEVRALLMVARREKQEAEMARDYAMEGGPNRLLLTAEGHETSARINRRLVRNLLRELEIRFNRAHEAGLINSYVSPSLLNGWRFKTWEPYQQIFDHDTKGCLDIWQ